MDIQQIRTTVKNQMPADLCSSSVGFLERVETQIQLIEHLKKYHHWSIYKNLITRPNIDLLGLELCNSEGIYVDQILPDISHSSKSCFIFGCSMVRIFLEGSAEFCYLKNSSVFHFFDNYQTCKHLVILPGCTVEELRIYGQINTLRVYSSRINNLSVKPSGTIKRLIFGPGAIIDQFTDHRIGRVVYNNSAG